MNADWDDAPSRVRKKQLPVMADFSFIKYAELPENALLVSREQARGAFRLGG